MTRFRLIIILLSVFFISLFTSTNGQSLNQKIFIPIIKTIGIACNDRKGIIGIEIQPSKNASNSYFATKACHVLHWNLATKQPYSPPYPLPSTPLPFLRSLGSDWSYIQFYQYPCPAQGVSNMGELACLGSLLEANDPQVLLWGNEIDGSDINFSDSLPVSVAVSNWYTISTTLRTSNPQIRFEIGGFLYATWGYADSFRTTYFNKYGASPLGVNDRWAYHLYPKPTDCHEPYTLNDAVCVHNAIATELSLMRDSLDALGQPDVMITEGGISPTGLTSPEIIAAFMPDLCNQIFSKTWIKRFYLFEGGHFAPSVSIIDASGNLTPVGVAYSNC